MTSAVATTAAPAAVVPTAPAPPKAPVAIELDAQLAGLAALKVELADQVKAFTAMIDEVDAQIEAALRKAGAEIAKVNGRPALTWGDTNRFPAKRFAGTYPEIAARFTTEQARMVEVFDEDGLARDFPDLHAEFRGRSLRVDTTYRQEILSRIAVDKALAGAEATRTAVSKALTAS